MRKRITALLLACCLVSVPVCADDMEQEQRVADLEGRVAALEEMLAPKDDAESTAPVAVAADTEFTKSGKIFTLTLERAYIVTELGMFDAEPEEGFDYLALDFSAQNISEEDDYINQFNVLGYVDDVAAQSKILISGSIKTLSGDILAGKKMNGSYVFAVPEDWQTFEFIYDEGYKGEKIKFTFAKDSSIFEG